MKVGVGSGKLGRVVGTVDIPEMISNMEDTASTGDDAAVWLRRE